MDVKFKDNSVFSSISRRTKAGLWVYEKEEGKKPRLYVNDATLAYLGLPKTLSPEEIYEIWFKNVAPTDTNLFLTAEKRMSEGKNIEVHFSWKRPNGKYFYARIGGTRNESIKNCIRLEGYYQNMADFIYLQSEDEVVISENNVERIFNQKFLSKEIENQLKSYSIISCLTNDYDYVAYIDSDNNEVIPYRESKRFFDIEQKFDSNLPSNKRLDCLLNTLIYPPDYYMFRKLSDHDITQQYLAENLSSEFECRFMIEGRPQYYRVKFTKASDNLNNVVMGLLNIDNQVRFEKEQKDIISVISEEFAFVGLIDINSDLIRVIHVNKESEKVLAYVMKHGPSFSSMRSQLEKLIPADDKKYFNKQITKEKIIKNVTKKGVYEFEARFNIKNKETYYGLKFLINKDDPDKIVIGFINIDDQVRLEIARGEAAGYKRAQTFADTFLHSYNAAYYVNLTDNSFIVFHNNEYMSKQYGKISNFSKFMAKYIQQDVHDNDRESMRELMNFEKIKERLKTDPHFSIYMRDVSQGSIHWYRVDISAGGDENHAGIAFTDVTAKIEEDEKVRFQMESQKKELEEALLMAQSANRAKTVFLNNMSHDIRTPMNAIIGFTGLATTHIDNTERVQDYLRKIGQSSDHLLSLINDILDMSRIESGKMTLNECEENLADLVHTIRNIVIADINAKQQTFFINTVDVQNERIFCDKLRLNQILLNLISNSIKYTRAGGTISLRIIQKESTEEGFGNFEFRVKDNGIGMDSEYVKTIFEPFSRESTATVSGIQGTGLGMTITKNIVDMMGGTIVVDSVKNEGTEFIVSLKLKVAESIKKTPTKLVTFEGMRGLVVDDDMNTCVSISKMLKEVGLRSEWCTSGKEAIVRSSEANKDKDVFKAYIIDWLLPDMNGIETTRRIRQIVGDDVPIFILTAYDWTDIEKEGKEAGVTDFIGKPLFPSDLRKALAKWAGEAIEEDDDPIKRYDFHGKKVLLVDDNAFNREIAYEYLIANNFVVELAENGVDAVEKIRKADENTYDVVLMDVQMPILDGYEATKEIRRMDSKIAKTIPIIAMTANAFEEDRKLALEAGMNEHISKPIDNSKLFEVLSRFL